MNLVRRFDHVGITVADLDAATAFFVALGLEVEGPDFVEGEFVDTVSGIPARSEIVMLRRARRRRLAWSCRAYRPPDHEPGTPASDVH